MMKNLGSAAMKAGFAIMFAAVSIMPVRAQTPAEKLYKAKCAVCHAADGSGDTAAGKKLGAHDFRSPEVLKLTDGQLNEIIAKGKNKMPGYDKTLKEPEIKGLVAYIRELAKRK